jgi:hypothetical protein
MNNILQDMLLIQEPSVFNLYRELKNIAGYFIAPVFTIALIFEFFGEMNFGEVIKKLLLITVFIGAFYQFHSKAVEISLESASYTLRKVSPRNLFVKKWYYPKVKTQEKMSWNKLQNIVIPNLNDLLATGFFLLAKIFLWLLKLIYSSVYHFTYVFSGVTAILYFLGWTKDALKGTVQASLWCMIMPFVIVAILSLVGNSIDETAMSGELLAAKVDTIIWLFGVTLLLLISPLITFGMIKGDGIHSFGSKMGSMVVSSGLKALTLSPVIAAGFKGAAHGFGKASANSLLEPSIKELLQKEVAPDNNKIKALNKKGAIKAPFDKGRPLEERLKEVGMTKEDAIKLSRVYSAQKSSLSQSHSTDKGANQARPENSKVEPKLRAKIGQLKANENAPTLSSSPVRLQKQHFKFNQGYWDKINPHKAEAIKKKYGIEGNRVDPNKVHRPVESLKQTNSIKNTKSFKERSLPSKESPVLRKTFSLKRPIRKERPNELR